MKFEIDIDRRNITNEMLLNDIAAVAARLGTKSPTADDYAKHGQFHPSTAIRRFRGWCAALTKAGLSPTHRNGGIDPERALADLRAVAARLGQTTVSNKQYLANGQFTDAPLLRAFGSWNAALKAAGLNEAKRARIPTEELFENLERCGGRSGVSRSMEKWQSRSRLSGLAPMKPVSGVGAKPSRLSWQMPAASAPR